ncbi:MAG: peroxiredoxin [Polyangiaceae bacterium]|nr:peroxiredoxin [Polyangiaceae bacterium]
MAKGIGRGDRAPRFELSAQDGKSVSLEQLLEKGPVVVFFYPKDETPGCTKEACSFRDSYDTFQEHGASVVGISSDSAASHRRFADKHGFPFLLLSDPEGAVRKQFGVPKTLGILDGRSTYVIDKGGVVQHVFHSQIMASKHVDEAIAALKSL